METLKPYRVIYTDEVDAQQVGNNPELIFDCMAEDAQHAIEQVENAYPGCDVVDFWLRHPANANN